MTELEQAYIEVKEQCDFIRDTAKRKPLSKSAAVVKSFDLALAALREKLEREKNEPPTNADRIRSSSNERLAVLFSSVAQDNFGGLYLTKEWLVWLDEPAEGEQHD